MKESVSFPKEIRLRISKPWNWSFSGYLLTTVLFGGVGVFFTIYEVYRGEWSQAHRIAESISIFFVAIIATSFVDLNMSKDLYNKKTFLIYSFLSYGLTIILLWLTFEIKTTKAFYPALLGLLLAIFIWIIANSDNKNISNYSADRQNQQEDFNEKLTSKLNKK